MAANPIVVAKASQLYPEMTFDFLTWFKGSVVPGMVCAVALPLILYWACGMMSNKKNGHDEEQLAGSTTASSHAVAASGNSKAAQQADNIDIVQHAQLELEKMGSMSAKEWVRKVYFGIGRMGDLLILLGYVYVATLFSASHVPCVVGDVELHQAGCNIGGTPWSCCAAAHGHHDLEGYFKKYQCRKCF